MMKPLQSVLYAAPLWPGSSSVPRLRGLESAGVEVNAFDTSDWWQSKIGILRSLSQRVYCTPAVRAMNRALLERAAADRPELVWIDKGCWVYPATLRSLRKYTRFIVGYNTDDFFGKTEHAWLYKLGLPVYDLCLTTNRFNTVEIPRAYGIKAVRAGMGFDEDFQRPLAMGGAGEKGELVFVGHWESHTEAYIGALLDAGVKVEVWGPTWRKARNRLLQRVVPLRGPGYIQKIAESRIALCFLSRNNRNESTARSFEIPAIGTFMLAERTAEHQAIYGDGRGAVLFSSPEELVSKARYYLDHADERRRIARAGQERIAGTGLSWQAHIRREWRLLERIFDGDPNATDDSPFWPGFRQGAPAPVGALR